MLENTCKFHPIGSFYIGKSTQSQFLGSFYIKNPFQSPYSDTRFLSFETSNIRILGTNVKNHTFLKIVHPRAENV